MGVAASVLIVPNLQVGIRVNSDVVKVITNNIPRTVYGVAFTMTLESKYLSILKISPEPESISIQRSSEKIALLSYRLTAFRKRWMMAY